MAATRRLWRRLNRTWSGRATGWRRRCWPFATRWLARPTGEAGCGASPLRFTDAWAALDVGFDGHDYQVWSLPEILEALRPKLLGLQALKRERRQFDPFRGRAEASERPRGADSTGPAAGPAST